MIILTGFGPFGRYTVNLSSQIVKKLPFELDEFHFIKKIIPVNWKESIRIYKGILYKLQSNPELVVLLGIHTKRNFNLEYNAWNFKLGDDEDNKFKFGPIKFNSPPWIKTILNLNGIYASLEDKEKISISFFPGFYICNYLYYWALYLSKKEYPVIFIHIPSEGNLPEYIQKVKTILSSIIKINLKKDLYI
ncbi:MAG: hypothetical protein ACFFA4_15145 [Promethearchaeota archaeon]